MKEANRKKQVLFIQGAGEGAYDEDEKLAVSLQAALGTEYQVLYPQMPNEEDPEDKAWIAQISKALAVVDGSAILVGHSAGGAVLLKYLLKEHVDQPFAGVFLVSIPFWSPEDEADGTYTLREGFASQLPKGVPIFPVP
jgi:predicted alpha/beta hydrolase family esterase